jgi:multicomponent Na+:H+ antiporter subunit A
VTRSSLILDTLTRAAFHTIWVASVYLLFAGHNAPGGGFIGGLAGGAALILRYAEAGAQGLRATVRLSPETLLGIGLLLAGGTGVAGWAFGRAFLSSVKVEAELPLLGTVKMTSTLPFDVGVYFVVIGLVLLTLRTLGEVRG